MEQNFDSSRYNINTYELHNQPKIYNSQPFVNPNNQGGFYSPNITNNIVTGAPTQGYNAFGHPQLLNSSPIQNQSQNYVGMANNGIHYGYPAVNNNQFQGNQINPLTYQNISTNYANEIPNMAQPIMQINSDELRAEIFGQVFQPSVQMFKIESRDPQIAYCSRCGINVMTRVEYRVGFGTIISGAFIALMGGTGGCCLIPCCLKDFKDAVHFCAICNQVLGTKKFIVK